MWHAGATDRGRPPCPACAELIQSLCLPRSITCRWPTTLCPLPTPSCSTTACAQVSIWPLGQVAGAPSCRCLLKMRQLFAAHAARHGPMPRPRPHSGRSGLPHMTSPCLPPHPSPTHSLPGAVPALRGVHGARNLRLPLHPLPHRAQGGLRAARTAQRGHASQVLAAAARQLSWYEQCCRRRLHRAWRCTRWASFIDAGGSPGVPLFCCACNWVTARRLLSTPCTRANHSFGLRASAYFQSPKF